MSYFYIPKNYSYINPEHFSVYSISSNTNNSTTTIHYYNKKLEKMRKKYASIWNLYNEYYFYYRNIININNSNKNKKNDKNDKKNNSITKFIALNRSFYVIWELNNIYDFLEKYKLISNLHCFHFSMCQTGIIQYLNIKRLSNNDKHNGIYSEEWRKNHNYLSINDNIVFDEYISYNILNEDMLMYCANKYNGHYDIITFLCNNEINMINVTLPCIKENDLIIMKIMYSLIIQKKGGTLIFSINGLIDRSLMDIFYLLSSCYNKIIITKPLLIKNTDNEKIVICSNYLSNYEPHFLYSLASNVLNVTKNKIKKDNNIKFLNIDIPSFFLNKLSEINNIMFQQMVDTTLSVINLKNAENIKEQLEKLKKRGIQKSLNWCIQNNFDYDKNIMDIIKDF